MFLGPLSEKSDPCGTCSKNVLNCPGHFGYIELPLPVVNPIFHKIIQTVLKVTCLSCYRMQIPNFIKQLLWIEMHLLDCGMITEAKEVELAMVEIINDNRSELSEGAHKRIKKLGKMAKSVGNESGVLNKTTESLRNKFINGMFKLIKSKKKCIHCMAPFEKIQSFKLKLMTNVRKPSDDLKKVAEKSSDLKIITPEESRQYMRSLWANDKDLLMEIIPVLKRINTENPTDIFYFDILPVPPPNVRPVSSFTFINKNIINFNHLR